jgi:hypothetical protein
MSLAFAFLVLFAAPQEPDLPPAEELPTRLPVDLELSEEGPQRYTFTCDYLATNSDDAFVGKQRLIATYVRNL